MSMAVDAQDSYLLTSTLVHNYTDFIQRGSFRYLIIQTFAVQKNGTTLFDNLIVIIHACAYEVKS